MAKESLTDTGADQSSSDIDNESLLDEQQQDQSADEQQQDTDSGDSDSQDSDSDSSSQAQDEDASNDSSDDDDGLKKFAKSQGFDPENLTDDTRKALKIAHDNQKAFRKKKTDDTNTRDLQRDVEEIYRPEKDADATQQILQRQALLEARVTTSDFYQENPEARDYAAEMREVLQEERENYGIEAARVLSQNLDRLYREARFRRGDFDGDTAREAGRREEREVQRKKQEGSSDSGQATTRSSSTPTIDRQWVQDVYEPGNPEHEKLLAGAMADGTLR